MPRRSPRYLQRDPPRSVPRVGHGRDDAGRVPAAHHQGAPELGIEGGEGSSQEATSVRPGRAEEGGVGYEQRGRPRRARPRPRPAGLGGHQDVDPAGTRGLRTPSIRRRGRVGWGRLPRGGHPRVMAPSGTSMCPLDPAPHHDPEHHLVHRPQGPPVDQAEQALGPEGGRLLDAGSGVVTRHPSQPSPQNQPNDASTS